MSSVIAQKAAAPTSDSKLRRPHFVRHLRELFRLRLDKSTARMGLVALGITALFGVIGSRLVLLAMTSDARSEFRR